MGRMGTTLFNKCIIAGVLLLLIVGCSQSPPIGASVSIATNDFQVWTIYDGIIEARHTEIVMSKFNGSAVITELAPEGAQVKAGDLLVRFDSSAIEDEIVKLDQEVRMAGAELDGLENAELPMDIQQRQIQLSETQCQLDSEKQFLEESRELLKQDLVSEPEIQQQGIKVSGLQSKADQLTQQMQMVQKHLHPSKMERARANLVAAQQKLQRAKEQLQHCTVLSPSAGLVVYTPLHIGGEFRLVRIGDTVYKNQPFMSIPDMRNLIGLCYTPESELGYIRTGCVTRITPLAFPELSLTGSVDAIGSMAQARPGFPPWQKYFQVTIRLSGRDDQLRPGMTASIAVLSYHNRSAVLIPRLAVIWNDKKPYCDILQGSTVERRPLLLGRANDQYFEVQSGVKVGERVAIP